MRPVPPSRRGACPAFHAPMATGDGLILRLVPASGALTPGQMHGLADAARGFGNGMMEITARGSLQVRGLSDASVARLQECVLALGIVPRVGVAVDVSPLSGLDAAEISDPRPLAAAIAADATAFAGRLGPKVSVVLDGGGAIAFDSQKADVRLVALGAGEWSLSVGSGARQRVSENVARVRAFRALAAIADLGSAARATDLDGALPSPVRRATRHASRTRPALGVHPLADGTLACGVGLPFGAGDATVFQGLAQAAETAGARDLRPAPGRVLLAIGLDAGGAQAFAAAAESLGCLGRGDDPRAAVTACPGAPACASGFYPARALAPVVAQALAPLLDGTVCVHLSGCAKGCARPAPATLVVVGLEGGAGLVHDGTASQATGPVRPLDAIVRDLTAVAAGRRAGEAGREALHRAMPELRNRI